MASRSFPASSQLKPKILGYALLDARSGLPIILDTSFQNVLNSEMDKIKFVDSWKKDIMRANIGADINHLIEDYEIQYLNHPGYVPASLRFLHELDWWKFTSDIQSIRSGKKLVVCTSRRSLGEVIKFSGWGGQGEDYLMAKFKITPMKLSSVSAGMLLHLNVVRKRTTHGTWVGRHDRGPRPEINPGLYPPGSNNPTLETLKRFMIKGGPLDESWHYDLFTILSLEFEDVIIVYDARVDALDEDEVTKRKSRVEIALKPSNVRNRVSDRDIWHQPRLPIGREFNLEKSIFMKLGQTEKIFLGFWDWLPGCQRKGFVGFKDGELSENSLNPLEQECIRNFMKAIKDCGVSSIRIINQWENWRLTKVQNAIVYLARDEYECGRYTRRQPHREADRDRSWRDRRYHY